MVPIKLMFTGAESSAAFWNLEGDPCWNVSIDRSSCCWVIDNPFTGNCLREEFCLMNTLLLALVMFISLPAKLSGVSVLLDWVTMEFPFVVSENTRLPATCAFGYLPVRSGSLLCDPLAESLLSASFEMYLTDCLILLIIGFEL